MVFTKQLKLALKKLLFEFESYELVVTDEQGNNITVYSDMAIGLGSELFTMGENEEMIPLKEGVYKDGTGVQYTVDTSGIVTEIIPVEVKEGDDKPIEDVKPVEDVQQMEDVQPVPTVDEIVAIVMPMIEEKLMAIIEEKLSKINFSKPADIQIKDVQTKINPSNKAAIIMGSK